MARRSAGGLSRVPVSVLEAEIRRRERGVGRLMKKRAKLQARLDALDEQIMASGGSAGGGRGRRGAGGGRKRFRNEMNLTEALTKTLSGKTMSVTEAAEAVQKAGYRTSADNFRTIVNQALIRGPFKKVSRGQYTAK